MKLYKLFITGCLMAFAMSANAQSKKKVNTTTTETTTYMTDSTIVYVKETADKGDYDMGYHLMPEVKFGSCYGVAGFGANVVLEREFHKYLAWDIFSVNFSAPFKFDAGNIGVKTGIRAFSPRFANDNLRGYTNLAIGYECNIYDELKEWRDGWFPVIKKEPHHGFGLTWGIGMQIKEHFFLGYDLEYGTAIKFTSHYGKFGYRF